MYPTIRMETAPRIYTCSRTRVIKSQVRVCTVAVSYEYSYIWGIRPISLFLRFSGEILNDMLKSVFYPTSRGQRWGRYKQCYSMTDCAQYTYRYGYYTDLISSLSLLGNDNPVLNIQLCFK